MPLRFTPNRGAGAIALNSLVRGPAGGSVTVPSTTTLNAVVLWNSATGAAQKNSGVTVDSSDNIAVPGSVTATGGIAASGGFSVSPRLIHTGGLPAVPMVLNDQTPVATEVYIAEVFVPANVTLTGVAVYNGSVASGNYKVGLANSLGAVVSTSASTAMSGTNAYQRVPFTATYAAKGPATFYVLLFVDNATARINVHQVGNFGASKQTGQVYATGFTTITAPTTFTTNLATVASLY